MAVLYLAHQMREEHDLLIDRLTLVIALHLQLVLIKITGEDAHRIVIIDD